MLKYGNKEFRNLQEQVLANMRNIEDIIKGQPIMAKYTIKIVGAVEDATKLPDPLTYKGDLGDIYVVGTKSPYNLYVFGKQYENEDAPSWIDLGAIWVEGPQGETGETGPQGPQGEKGDQGDSATITVGTTTTGAAGSDASVTNSGTASASVLNFTIPQGKKGDKGDKGDTGLGVPEIQSGDAGKALMVNPGETDAEWTTLPSSLPDIESGDAGKLLMVNSTETDAEWATGNFQIVPGPSGAVAFNGKHFTQGYKQSIDGLSNEQENFVIGSGFQATEISGKKILSANPRYNNSVDASQIIPEQTITVEANGGLAAVRVGKMSLAAVSTRPVWYTQKSSLGEAKSTINSILTAGLTILGFIEAGPDKGAGNEIYLVCLVRNPTDTAITLTISSSYSIQCYKGLSLVTYL